MPKKDEIQDFYFNTREVAETLEPRIKDQVEEEFGIKGKPDLKDSKSHFAAAAYGLSSLLADSFYERTDKVFYENRSENFEEFARESIRNKYENSFKSNNYITIADLYSEIADDLEEVETGYPNEFTLAAMNKRNQKETVFTMMEEFAEELTNLSSTLDQLGPVS